MKIQEALSSEQVRRLSVLGVQDRTDVSELRQIAQDLVRYLHDRGDLQDLMRHEALQLRPPDAAATRLEDEALMASGGSLIFTSQRQSVAAGDPTYKAAREREKATAELIGNARIIQEIPAALFWSHRWLRPSLYPMYETEFAARHRATYLSILARTLDTTERKLIEMYHLADEFMSKAGRDARPGVTSLGQPAYASSPIVSRCTRRRIRGRTSMRSTVGMCRGTRSTMLLTALMST